MAVIDLHAVGGFFSASYAVIRARFHWRFPWELVPFVFSFIALSIWISAQQLILPYATLEFAYILAKMALYFLAATGLLFAYQAAYKERWFHRLSVHLCLMWSVVALSGLVFVFSDAYRAFVGEVLFVGGREEWIATGRRSLDVVSGGGFNGAMGYVFAAGFVLVVSRIHGFSRWWSVSAVVLLSITGMLMARSFIPLFVVAVIFSLFLSGLFNLRSQSTAGRVSVEFIRVGVLFGVVAAVMLYVAISVLDDRVLRWAFEFFDPQEGINITGSGRAILERMYFLPDTMQQFWLGGGYLGRWDAGPYIPSDVGYIRVLFNVGIIVSFAVWVPFLVLSIAGSWRYLRTGDSLWLFVAVVPCLVLLANFKELYLFGRSGGMMALIMLLLPVYVARRTRRCELGQGYNPAL